MFKYFYLLIIYMEEVKEFEQSKINLVNFIEIKIQHFKKMLYELSSNKEKVKEMDDESETIKFKSQLMFSLLFLNENNKDDYIKKIMDKCYIENTPDNYFKIDSYFVMLFELKNSIFNH